MTSTTATPAPASADAYRTVAVTALDAIRERLIAHAPVTSAHEALILAYTRRQLWHLAEVVTAHDVPVDLDGAMKDATIAVEAAQAAGYQIPVIS